MKQTTVISLNKICKKFPVLYRAGPKNYHFNLKTFWIYIMYGLIHSILCFIIPSYSLRNIINSKGEITSKTNFSKKAKLEFINSGI